MKNKLIKILLVLLVAYVSLGQESPDGGNKTNVVVPNKVIVALQKETEKSYLPPDDEYMEIMRSLFAPEVMVHDETLNFFHSLKKEDLGDVLIALELYYMYKKEYELKRLSNKIDDK